MNNSFTTFSSLVSDASSKFKRESNSQKIKSFKEVCATFDMVAEKFSGVFYEIEVDEDTLDIVFTLVSEEFETYVSADLFCDLIKMSKRMAFKKYDDEQVEIKFCFDGVWDCE